MVYLGGSLGWLVACALVVGLSLKYPRLPLPGLWAGLCLFCFPVPGLWA